MTTGVTGYEQDRQISEVLAQHESKLRSFVRSRVPNPEDVEDILQDVFFELVEAYRLMKPIRVWGAWLFQVARNRIVDRFRRSKVSVRQIDQTITGDSDELLPIEELLPSSAAGPDAAYARSLMIEELLDALDELPEEQRSVFIAHELEGRSFRELSEATNVSVNTLLSRKRYAVLFLRDRLASVYEEYEP